MAENEVLAPDALRQILSYEPETGVLRWVGGQAPRAQAGDVAGYFDKHKGYVRVTIQGSRLMAHRVAWALHHGAWPDSMLDHIDGNGQNNAISNLRPATNAQNQQNRAVQRNNRSGFTGVSWDARDGAWAACIRVGGKLRRLGKYTSPERAHEAYCTAKRRLHEFNPEPVYRAPLLPVRKRA